MNEPISKIADLANDLLVGTKTLEEISAQYGQGVVEHIEEFIRTNYQYDCHGG